MLLLFIIFIFSVLYLSATADNVMKINHYDYYPVGNTINNSITKIGIVSGVHGNERAGPIVFSELVKNNYFEDIMKKTNKMMFRVIPIVNTFGFKHNIRTQNTILNADINRNFHENGPIDTTSKELSKLIENMDIIIDFHEGWGFHKINPTSIGSTITVNKNSYNLGKYIVDELNKYIIDDKYKFTLLHLFH